ncbi:MULTISPECIES: hypothetical protein [Pseudomonas]|uniref:Uncharacterized protein n=3 Tax=Pseudomonas syringae group TaxID=136849 RepID=A0A3M4IMW1_PSEVI|nr:MULTISPECIES: hypothetical protein [Pseudomonas]KTB73675.1 hypothetical protein AO068_04930 [Pseudomonas sp. ICMP 3272]KTC54075.1 hypothetical protein AO258_05210 [Pseudomonas syringae ICMP 19498]RMP11767.1 hypothetical protein ALQ30_03206 [Pseudomonas syringae pv. persicae]RMQ06064.1 hypothetical protein ALQ09_00224 [Pseudomonas viridiflava]RMQ75763.1 hypothetical protein ALP98_03787 [Pseudomonas viridiflava]
MSSIHEQAMNYVYQQVLQRLLGYFTRAERTALQLLIQRLIVAAGGIERISGFKVLVAFGGGKDSAYTLAFLRAAQLSIACRSPGTFNLRVANRRHAGMTPAVMDNINRTYSALFLYDDPRVETLVIDNQYTQAFEPDLPFSSAGREQNRLDMLLGGHLSAGDARTTFCNTCYLGLAEFLGRALSWGNGVDAVVSGDSRREQRQYATWIMRLAQRSGQYTGSWGNQTLAGVLKVIDTIGQAYYHELYGDGEDSPRANRSIAVPEKANAPAFITIADLVSCKADEHWNLLTEFLDFRFDDLSFGFSESDCANPLLMAHMRGLTAQYLQERNYADGIAEYLELATSLMRRKQMPPRLIDQALSAYAGRARIETRRELASGFAQEGFGLNETQLVCMLFSPFVNQGDGLEAFLRRCHPGMLVALPDLHKALSGSTAPDQVMQWLVDISGLNLKSLQNLYGKQRVNFDDPHSIIARIRAADPDKRRIMTVDPATGQAVVEMLSGR